MAIMTWKGKTNIILIGNRLRMYPSLFGRCLMFGSCHNNHYSSVP